MNSSHPFFFVRSHCCGLSVRLCSYMESCTENPDIRACGFKMMFNMFNNRISDDTLDYMLERQSLKIICLARRNVYEQALSMNYKKFSKCRRHELSELDCNTTDNFTMTKAVRGRATIHCTDCFHCLIAVITQTQMIQPRFATQRVFVDFCWTLASLADVLTIECVFQNLSTMVIVKVQF